MILFGSTPDHLAQQQYAYDQFNQGAAEANRNASLKVQAENINAILRQREAQANAVANQQRRDFEARQNALALNNALEIQRQQTQNTNTQYKYATDKEENTRQEEMLKEFRKLAESGQVDAKTMESYRQSLTPDRFARAQGILASTAKSIADAWQEQNQPQIDASKVGGALADRLNTLPVAEDYRTKSANAPFPNAAPSPVSAFGIPAFSGAAGAVLNAPASAAAWLAQKVYPPTPDTSWAKSVNDALSSKRDLAAKELFPGTKIPKVELNPENGLYQPGISMPVPPAGYNIPAFAPTAAAPTVQTPPGAPPQQSASRQTIKDRRGRTWIYKGTSQNPQTDTNKLNWQLVG